MHDLTALTKYWYRLQWLDVIALLQIYSTEIECSQQYNTKPKGLRIINNSPPFTLFVQWESDGIKSMRILIKSVYRLNQR